MAASATQDEPVLEPLRLVGLPPLQEWQQYQAMAGFSTSSSSSVECIMCSAAYDAATKRNELFKHMVEAHRLVVGDTKLIADLSSYLSYWKKRFASGSVADYCVVIQTNSKDADIGPRDQYYLLCDTLPEDRALREQLQQRLLVRVLEDQQSERADVTFSKRCLFCLETFTGNRSLLINHMNVDHNFNIGHPDNIVYAAEFMDVMHTKLENLECLFCEKTFKDRGTLKEHMRKKQHRQLDPRNAIYDKYYIINYLELGKNWQAITGDDYEEDEEDGLPDDGVEVQQSPASDTKSHSRYCGTLSDWTDWQECTNTCGSATSAEAVAAGAAAFCLFCRFSSSDADSIFEHMKTAHEFDMNLATGSRCVNFYHHVKVINYIRRQVHQCICVCCFEKFEGREQLLHHMTAEKHFRFMSGDTQWDQPQYYFSTFEDDALLFRLQDDNADDDGTSMINNSCCGHAAIPVIAEDLPSMVAAHLNLLAAPE